MKRRLIVAASLFCLLFLGFGADVRKVMAVSKPGTWDELVEAAKLEGKVMVYGGVGPELRKEIRKAFTGKYGVNIEFLYIPRGMVLAAKVKKEREADQYVPDIIIHQPATFINLLKPGGILDPMEPFFMLSETADPQIWRRGLYFIDEARMIKPMLSIFMRYAIRNTDEVKEWELSSYRELLDRKWKGKIVMGDPTGPGSTSDLIAFLTGIWGSSQTVEFLRHLVKQGPVISNEARPPVEWVARGKYPVGIGLKMDLLPEFLKLGLPVASVKMAEGGKLGPGGGTITIVNKRPHPNAAVLFLNWVLTREGQTVWSKASGFASARLDVSTEWVQPSSSLPEPGEKSWIEHEGSIKARNDFMKRVREIFAPILK